MKLRDLLEAISLTPFTKQVEDMLWQEYKQDPFFSAQEATPDLMSDEDYLDFEEHVEQVVKFAKENRIQNPQEAIDAYTDFLSQQQRKRLVVH